MKITKPYLLLYHLNDPHRTIIHMRSWKDARKHKRLLDESGKFGRCDIEEES